MATRTFYGTTKDGRPVERFTLTGPRGLAVSFINYGCRLTSLLAPGREGTPGQEAPSPDAPGPDAPKPAPAQRAAEPNPPTADILLGYDTLAAYEADSAGMGACIGRYAGRIEGAAFALEGVTYPLTQNDGQNFLHGSFAHRVFEVDACEERRVCLRYTSPDGEDGFPGEVAVRVCYTLTPEGEFVMDYTATATKPTHVNLTNHAYFNLAGEAAGTLAGHTLLLAADSFLEAKPDLCPTGHVLAAQGAFCFLDEKPIDAHIAADDPQIALAGGYDHCFLLDKLAAGALTLAAVAQHPQSGRVLRVYTTQPAVQLYTANALAGGQPGKGGRPYANHSAFCLETQHCPNTPNLPQFPTTLLSPGEVLHEQTVLRFW